MISTVKAAAIDQLKDDTAVKALLGGEFVYPGHFAGTQKIPGCYVTGSDRTAPRPGYMTSRHRDVEAELVVNAFHAGTAKQADDLATAVDTCLAGSPLANTHGWQSRTTEQFEEDSRLHHRTVRFEFSYSLQD
ncbi:MAG TPA: DUF3168 domain-containing protein [Methanoregulaceae archaeon]|nr:DUF3168 domain-containing protein [Methanoregulaceae archaeon]